MDFRVSLWDLQSSMETQHSLFINNVHAKIKAADPSLHLALSSNAKIQVPETPGRDVQVLVSQYHPDKKGLSTAEGQARLLHDLASIELQAFELALRTLFEYPEAPKLFREELAALAKSESEHLQLCLDGMEALGFKWGDWPVHLTLWQAVSAKDSLLDRILIVHRYLEGSGLDAGNHLLRRLNGVSLGISEAVLKRINTEEVDHVLFGSRWYHNISKQEGLDPEKDFPERLGRLRFQLPKRFEKINDELRAKAGFTHNEIQSLKDLRESILAPSRRINI